MALMLEVTFLQSSALGKAAQLNGTVSGRRPTLSHDS